MSHDEVVTLETALAELEQRILARVGKWALTIIGSCVVIAVAASSQWFGVIERVGKLETWKNERAVGITEYSEFRTALEGRLSRLEAGQAEILRLLQSDRLR